MAQPQTVDMETNEYVDFWNEILVPKFIQFKHVLVGGLTKHSEAILPCLDVRDGDKVVDVGCGFGDTAVQFAERVGDSGSVVGMDCCEAFMEFGRKEVTEKGIDNVSFIEADVQAYPFEGEYDFCFSRFGTQFFENPVMGLRAMRRSLRPGGRMTMIVWRAIDDNPWLGLPKQIILDYLPPSGEDARTCGPGPFSMANQEMVTKQLEIAGFKDIEFRRVDVPLKVGNDVKDAVAFQLALGPAGEVYREAGDLAKAKHEEIEAALHKTLQEYAVEDGSIVMDSSSWVISAVNPE